MRKIFSLIVIGVFILLNLNLARTSFESSQKLEQINKEVNKVEVLQEKNNNLKSELQKRESSFFIEQQARDKLGYGRNGEVAIVVENKDLKGPSPETTEQTKSNFQKWLDLLRIKN